MNHCYTIIGWQTWFVDMPIQTEILRFSSLDTSWEDLPKDGMQGIVLFQNEPKPDGFLKRATWSNYDYYFKGKGLKDVFYGCDVEVRNRNIPDEIGKRYPGSTIIRGSFTDLETLMVIQEEMKIWQQSTSNKPTQT